MFRSIKWEVILLLIACIVAYSPVLNADFIDYDDPEYVTGNAYIKKLNLQNLTEIFKGKATILYVPLTITSYYIDTLLLKGKPGAFHSVNLLIHLLNVVLLWKCLSKLKVKESYALIILVFFSLCPLITESVCWITERKDVLYVFFSLLSVLYYLKFFDDFRKQFYLLSFFFFICSCFSKPMAITLPFLLFIYEYFSGRFTKKTIPLLLPFVVVSVIFSIVAYFSILTYTGDRTGQLNYNAFEKVYLFITETGYYFSKVFFPVNPSLFHFFPAKSALYHPDLLIPFFIGLGILGLLFFYRKNRIISGAFVAWLGMLLPVLQIIPNTHSYVSERYFYLTIIFPVIILLEISRSRISDNRMRQVALIVLFIFCIFTYRQSKNWKNTETLFTYELSIDPRNPMANNNLGYYYNGRNQFEKARPMLAEAMRADSLNGQYYSNYGWCLAGLGKIDSSIIYFEKAIHLKRDLFEAHNNLGICYFRTNRKEDAFREFKTAEQLKADHPEVLYNLGAYYLQDKNSDLAKTYLSRASILGHQGAANLLRKYNL